MARSKSSSDYLYETEGYTNMRRSLNQFENDLTTPGKRPTIEEYLSDAKEAHRWEKLRNLLQIELDHRNKEGEYPLPDEYCDRFEEFKELIILEFRKRVFKIFDRFLLGFFGFTCIAFGKRVFGFFLILRSIL